MRSEAWRRVAGTLLPLVLFAFVTAASAREAAAVPEIAAADLAREARETLQRIKKGGPFPYERDGIVFGNREKLLPLRERGYYREYTVATPGTRDRGARRIVAGGCDDKGKPATTTGVQSGAPRSSAQRFVAPCSGAEYYYTDDHYGSFKRIRE